MPASGRGTDDFGGSFDSELNEKVDHSGMQDRWGGGGGVKFEAGALLAVIF